MANFIVSPLAISFDSILADLQNYVSSKPDGEAWKDFYASSAGETILEIAAALGAFYSYQFIMGRRESYLSVAQNYSSVLGLAQTTGYNVSRGENLQLSINIVPTETLTLPKWTIVGNYTEYDVVLTEDVILNAGVSTNIPVIIGNFLQETKSVTTNQLMQFTFSNANVTDTCRLMLNDTEVPTSTNIKDALNDKYIMISNSLGSVDAFYLNTGSYKYMTGDTLYLQFIERNSINSLNFSKSNLSIFVASQVNEYIVLQDKTDKESIDSVRLKAPIYHETSGVIRSRKDYSKYLLTQHPSLITANDRDIEPGLIEITYLTNNGSMLSEEEKKYWLERIEEARPSGVAKAIISDPITVNKQLSIDLWKASNENISTTISDEIDNILSSYENTFEVDIDLNQIEHDIEKLTGIKIARVNLGYTSWSADSYYNTYDIIEDSLGNTYYVGKFVYRTGEEEPDWNVSIGDFIIDNEIKWTRMDSYKATVIDSWKPNEVKEKYDYIRVVLNDEILIFQCSEYVNKTGTTEPTWGADFVYDNNIIWQKVEYIEQEETWEADTIKSIGDIITIRGYTYACSNYRGKTSQTEPVWENVENGIVDDGNIRWTLIDISSRTIALQWNEHIVLNKIYSIVG